MDAIANLSGYQIRERLYAGLRTLVYRGIRESDGQPVVIKLLHNPLPKFSELVQFRNQYTIAKNLNLPSIIKPLSLEAYGNSYALIMEDFGGISLSAYLKGDGKHLADTNRNQPDRSLPLAEFLNIALQLTDILHYLYQNRVIHKDIKPANILINPHTKKVKLIDFSIASLLPRETQTIHNPNILEGTLAYISPEQTGRMNRALDYRTDFYSLGITCYKLLTGKLPFISEDPMELVHCHLAKQAIPAHQINPEIPLVLSSIVGKLMAKNAENRYQSGLGLKRDLEICLAQLQETGDIKDFVLGENDICDRFIIPEKLYGRATEVASLLAAFERVAGRELENQSQIEMMLVAGFSGIGKTAVVNEIHKPIVRGRGYFIKGKYDQFQRNIPFSAFVQAFRDLMEQLLSESDAKLQEWQTKIQQALGENGQVIVEIIPELERIIGKQPPVSELAGTAAENRFNLVFQKFISVFSKKEHPLAIFLDDLQWSDSASLKLLQLLTSEKNSHHLLIIGAYRDNEVFPTHPFMVAVAEMAKAGTVVNTITLQPLTQVDINDAIADTLICDRTSAQPLTELVYQKTKGNPFFATQFLKSLHENGMIVFEATPAHEGNHGGIAPTENQSFVGVVPPCLPSPCLPQRTKQPWANQGGWQCDIAKVKSLSITSDVVEFMALQLQKLPPATQDVLKLAACIGAQFDLKTLALVSEKSPEETAADLWRGLSEGFILPTSEIYKFYQGQEERKTTDLLPTNAEQFPSYKFLHDRVQQAAYSSMADGEKQATNLKIGRLLQENFTEVEAEEKLFDIVGHLNRGIDSISQPSERKLLAKLNLKAGGKARLSTAYAAASVYLQTGLGLLTENCWKTDYELTLNLYVAAAESAYLNGDFEGMEQMAAIVLHYAQTILDKVKIYEIQIIALTAQSKLLEAIAVGRNALAKLGVELPIEPDEVKIGEALQALNQQLSGRQIEEFVNLPVMTDTTTQAAIQLLRILFPPILLGMPALLPLLTSVMVSLSLSFGNAPASAVGYASHAMVLSAFLGDIETGYSFGQLALSLLNKFNIREFKSQIILLFGYAVQHRRESLKAVSVTLKDGYATGIETGDFLNAGYNICSYFPASLWGGFELASWEPEIVNYSAALAKIKQYSAKTYLDITQEIVRNLRETKPEPELLIGNAYDERVMLPQHQQNSEFTAIAFAGISKLMLAYVFGNYTAALDCITQVNLYLMAVAGTINIPVFHFYAALTRWEIFPSLSESDQVEILSQIEIHQATLYDWAQTAPMNHLHKWHLVEAQRQKVLGNKLDAIESYDRAISIAKENHFLNEEALANELAAKFYLEWGKEKVAQTYMQEAYYCYARWGAKAKIDDLETRYRQLLTAILRPQSNDFSIGDTRVQSLDRSSILDRTIHKTRSTSSSISEALDFATILKASQALSSEIQLEQLIATLMQVVMENAGCQKAALLLWQDDILMVEALANNAQNISIISVPMSSFSELPATLINYVKRTLKTVVLDDATAENNFSFDPYLMQEKPKSVLCAPILNQGKLIGLLYLENQLTIGAFTRDRTEIVQLLCTQAAISIENARLYALEQEKNDRLLRSEARFRQLIERSADSILIFDLDRMIFTDCNQAAVDLIGFSCKEQLIGLSPLDLCPEVQPDGISSEEKAAEMIGISVERGSHRFEWLQNQVHRGTMWVEIVLTLMSFDGKPIFQCIFRDISDRKQAEVALLQKSQQLEQTLEELKQAQLQMVQNEKMATLGSLVAGVAHEINNPIGFIAGSINNIEEYLQYLLDHVECYQKYYPEPVAEVSDNAEDIDLEFLIEDWPKLIASMKIASQRIREISNSLRTFSRADTAEKVACDIHEGINSTLLILKYRLKASEKRPAVEVISEYGKLPLVKCFLGQLNQVFMNIIANAIDALDAASVGQTFAEIEANPQLITICTEVSGDGVPPRKLRQMAVIRIRDNGPGMSEEVRSHIFDHLFTTKEVGKGTGLGLAIARQIVEEKHGGKLSCISAPGRGTEFVIEILID
ncbi:AAA family ATPase [Microcoleus sp. herbarium19]|uniref:trifunctional serine/threonine-protein kinase/ATP-binding protein/sensor histidine kinase n=1 Tax=unclassified Microcoleus TaxID=2642155 RepID=UPI002FD455A0